MLKEKLPKSVILLPIAFILCCFGPLLLAGVTAGVLISFIKDNLLGVVAFGLPVLLVLSYLVIEHYHKKSKECMEPFCRLKSKKENS